MQKKIGISKEHLSFIPEDWQTKHRIYGLRIEDKSLVLSFLAGLERNFPDEIRLIKSGLRLVGQNDRVFNQNRVKRGSKFKEVYEIRGKHSRLFFFYESPGAAVILTSGYWKAKASQQEQDAAFEKADRLRGLYCSK